jgi:cytochrome c
MRTLLISAAMLASLAACGKATEPPAPDAPETTATPAAPDATAPDAAAPAVADANAAGAAQFKKCVACHTIDKGGPNRVGPNLWGIVGRPVASHAGFAYSAAMKAKGGNWDDAALDAYLTSPMKAVPGGKMAFAGIADAADRAALIAYLKAQAD